MKREVPWSREAEAGVLGSLILKPAAVDQVLAELVTDDFFLPAHREIFDAVVSLHRKGRELDAYLLTDELRLRGALGRLEGGDEYLMKVVAGVPHAEHLDHYLGVVQEKARLRRLVEVAADATARAMGDYGDADELLEDVESRIFKLTHVRRSSTFTTRQLAQPALDAIAKRMEKPGALTGVPTGFAKLDKLLGGLQPEQLVIVAGRPSMGKTSWALNVIMHAATHGIPCLVFSAEMSKDELMIRLLAGQARVGSEDLQRGALTMEEYRHRVYPAGSTLADAPITIDETAAPSLLHMSAAARRWRADPTWFPQAEDPAGPPALGLIAVDYVQLARGNAAKYSGREAEVADISRGLKALAKSIRVPVVAVSQLNRELEKRTDKRPQLSDLRESGSLEQDADVIVFLFREDYYNPEAERGKAEAIVRKNRNGQTGTVLLSWHPRFTRFDNYADDDPGWP